MCPDFPRPNGRISNISDKLDVPLSTRASEESLSRIQSEVTSGDWRLKVRNDEKLANLDVLLSSRASESTLAGVRDRLPASLTTAGNLKVSLQEHSSESVVLLASGARTSSGSGSDVDVERFDCAEICIKVTSVSGSSPTLDVYVEGKDRYTGEYKPLVWRVGITTIGTYWLDTIVKLIFKYIRVRWVIGGTSPSFTFSVSGEFKS